MLYMIGLGLGDAKDITVKGLEVLRRCSRVYLEAYTSVLTVGKEVLLYRFGETVSVVFWTDTWRPESFFDKVKKNRQNGMHTLCLLVWKWLGSLSLYTKLVVLIELQKGWAAFVSRDIKVKEQSLENLIKGRKIYEPPHYMSVNQAAQQLLEIVQNQRIRGEEPAVTEETLCVGLARVGAEDQKIAAGTLQQMCTVDLGGPLHSLIITGGSLHPLEMEMLSLFSIPEKSSESQSIDGL
ncbi:diphthine methyl ester synthase isoform X3 [Lagenorhynchus albirostris]|uniref:diphthine methyl ester synthase isoform X3 n=1 Tax=Lagenorhynchus albirostris TaxID=27610 RepID=UPI0028E88624|nr:diphthine methyl ester synthase isoform X3 [Lagenorhynchus albirostris]